MYTLPASKVLNADADAGSVLTMTIFGMEYSGGTEVYKDLAQAQIAASVAAFYTVPASTTAFIRTITIVNTDSASHTFQLFIGGTAASNAITPVYTVAAGGQAVYEDGLGWQFFTSGGSLITSSGGAVTNEIHTGYSEYQAISLPAVPAIDTLRFYGRKLGGRMIPKWTPPSGVDQAVQPQLWGNHIVQYYPSSSTNGGTATLGGFGQSWTAGGTVSHPTPASGSLMASIHRTRYANVVTTQNQTLGLSSIGSGVGLNWFRGDGSGRGGFFMHVRYSVELWAAATCRIWVGLQSSTTSLAASDISAWTGDLCGFAHDTTDAGTQMWFVTRDNVTTNKASITVPTIAAGNVYDFFIYCKPGDSTIFYRMDDLVNGTTIVDTSVTSNLPRTTIFMGPVIQMSNGTANTTVTTVAPGIAKVYIESDY